jgi:hypothetical protein
MVVDAHTLFTRRFDVFMSEIENAHILFTRRFDVFMSEIENATILEEIKLEKMKYETINSEQLKFTYRNSYITLAGLLLTALLTVANIVVTSIKDQKNE